MTPGDRSGTTPFHGPATRTATSTVARTRRFALAAVATVAALLLTACGSSGSPEASQTPADVAWADSVCQRATELETSVAAIGEGLSLDPKAGGVLDQLQQQLTPQIQTVTSDVADLAGAVAAVPTGSNAELTAAADQLAADKSQLESAVDALQAAISTFTDAQGAAAKVAALAGVTTAFGQAGDAAKAFGSSLDATAKAGGAAVEKAFADAPACQARTAS